VDFHGDGLPVDSDERGTADRGEHGDLLDDQGSMIKARRPGLSEPVARTEEVAVIVARGCDSHENVWHAAGAGGSERESTDMSADGKWEISMNTPMGAQSGSLDFKVDGNTLTGTMSAAAAPEPMEITDGTVDGANLTWKAALTQPMPITLEFAALVEDDKISGNVKLGSFGEATFEGTRA